MDIMYDAITLGSPHQWSWGGPDAGDSGTTGGFPNDFLRFQPRKSYFSICTFNTLRMALGQRLLKEVRNKTTLTSMASETN